ncbi:MAG TPA: hypothetical protein VET85_06110, partial [Stellaceae bacterium]|nr:hypothetical protein [Stellaceae bacterium]
MADTVGPLPPTTGLPVSSSIALPTQAVIELAQTPPAAVLLASTLSGVVIGRNVDGALLLSTDLGTLALKTLLAIAPGTPVDLRLVPGPPPTVILLPREEPAQSATPRSDGGTADASGAKSGALRALASLSAAEEPPTQLAIGTEVEAILLAPAAGGPADLTAGTHLVLRVAIIPPPSTPVAPAGSSSATFTGLVVSGAANQLGRTTVETPIGTLVLDRALPVAPGTVLSIERIATLALKPAAGAELGTVLGATVVAPAQGGTSPALAAGTRLMLRVTPTPPSSGTALPSTGADDDVFVGTVMAGTTSETMVETPIGMLALERRLALPPGTLLGLQRLAVTPPDAPVEEPFAQRSSWPALQDALGALDRVAPGIAAQLRADLTPKSGPELAGTLLFLLGALGSGTWPGAK